MNYWISVLFRIIPLAWAGAICLAMAGTSGIWAATPTRTSPGMSCSS